MQYATCVQKLCVKKLSLIFFRFKEMYGLVFVLNFKKQIGNINREVQGGRPLRIYQNALRPKIIRNCPNTSQRRIRHTTKLPPVQTDLTALVVKF